MVITGWPTLADAFSAFNVLYVCTDSEFSLNQCNWELETLDSTLQVRTVVGAGNNYTASASLNEGRGFERQVVVQGEIGDLGNLTIDMYEDGLVTVSRVSTRTATGAETVQYTSADTTWYATETAECSRSLDYDSTSNGDTLTLDATWSFSGQVSSGSLDFFKTGMDNTFELNW